MTNQVRDPRVPGADNDANDQSAWQGAKMKKDIHPDYRPVVFQDVSTGYSFLTRSTVDTDRTITWEDGNEYPLLTLEISSASHPFYTGTQRLLDSAGRVERFQRRYARGKGDAQAAPAGADEGDASADGDEADS